MTETDYSAIEPQDNDSSQYVMPIKLKIAKTKLWKEVQQSRGNVGFDDPELQVVAVPSIDPRALFPR